MLSTGCADVSNELRTIILQNKICKILQFLCHFVNSVHNGQFCARRPLLCKLLPAQNHRILTSLDMTDEINVFSLC